MQCPRKFHLQFISKSFKEEEKSVHLVKGEELHKQLEHYVLAKNGQMAMPLGFSTPVRETLPYVDKLYSIYNQIFAEAQLASDVNWKPTDWFGPTTAWRSIWDVTGLRDDRVFVGDYKSGRVYPYGDGFGQLHLSAVMGLHRFETAPEITAAYIYIEHKKIEPVRVTREPTNDVDSRGRKVPHLAEVQTYFDQKLEQVQMEKAFEPIANDNCKYCQATRAQCPNSRKL
jgi:PD-(D/E)XK nuclease superfamily